MFWIYLRGKLELSRKRGSCLLFMITGNADILGARDKNNRCTYVSNAQRT